MGEDIITLYRARIARERGIEQKDWGGKISIALVYPNYYSVGMSSLGFQTVYQLLNRREDVVAERVFSPGPDEISLYGASGKGLLSLESQSPLRRFDIVAFSLSFENDYPSILKILRYGKLPLLSEERDESHPLVMAGGITTFLNPEPLAPFFDLFLLGEAEAILSEFIEIFKNAWYSPLPRRERLITLVCAMGSLYAPSLYRVEYGNDGRIKHRESLVDDLPETIKVASPPTSRLPVSSSAILAPDTELADRMLVELGRGCIRSCRFCAAGYVYRPPRFHAEANLRDAIETALKRTNSIGLLSASVLDTPGIETLAGLINERKGTFSVSSLRADLITQALLDQLKSTGQKSLALAPEAGSERMRRVINKHITEEDLTRAVRLIARTGTFTLRLYFLVGLPTETMEDVEEIIDLVKRIQHHMVKESRSRGTIGRIRLSVNCFIPKAFTPFQWFPLERVPILKEKQKWLKNALRKVGGVAVNFDVPKWAYLQALLARGDRRVSALLMSYDQNQDWNQTFRYSELNPDFFVYRPKDLDEILPWDFIDHGIRKEYLIKEYHLALQGKESDICRVGECVRCGVCET